MTGKSQAPKPKKVAAEPAAKPGPKVVKPNEKPASASTAAAKPKSAGAGAKVVKSAGAKAGGGAKPSSAGGKSASKAKSGAAGGTGVGMEPDIALEEAEGR